MSQRGLVTNSVAVMVVRCGSVSATSVTTDSSLHHSQWQRRIHSAKDSGAAQSQPETKGDTKTRQNTQRRNSFIYWHRHSSTRVNSCTQMELATHSY